MQGCRHGRGGLPTSIREIAAAVAVFSSHSGRCGCWAAHRVKLFKMLPKAPVRPVVFAGDSLSACEWWELFGQKYPLINRGIHGDTSLGLLERMPDVLRLQPRAVFLMIGINDRNRLAYAPGQTLTNYAALVAMIKEHAPASAIYLQSLLPTRDPSLNDYVRAVNQGLRRVAQRENATYLDIHPGFADEQGLLAEVFSVDGLHLNHYGYWHWREQIRSEIEKLFAPESRSSPVGSISR